MRYKPGDYVFVKLATYDWTGGIGIIEFRGLANYIVRVLEYNIRIRVTELRLRDLTCNELLGVK